ncbi:MULTISPECIES: DUF3040 domain-containing protein [unclassified Nonomuraea]|uniref:DUF3040 domain-containing protein n=1 Tax=Nonomuraea sp. NPDC003804 TaxID=3154547 RepID=UPI0033AE8F5A
MSLSARERKILDAIARQLATEEPALVRGFAEHGRGPVTAERINGRWEAWPVALIAVCMAVFAVVLLVSGNPRS